MYQYFIINTKSINTLSANGSRMIIQIQGALKILSRQQSLMMPGICHSHDQVLLGLNTVKCFNFNHLNVSTAQYEFL
jgi:hypothetical protein